MPRHPAPVAWKASTRPLVDARRRVDATVEEQNARIESLQSEIHRDAVTWLPNRKYFMDRFARR